MPYAPDLIGSRVVSYRHSSHTDRQTDRQTDRPATPSRIHTYRYPQPPPHPHLDPTSPPLAAATPMCGACPDSDQPPNLYEPVTRIPSYRTISVFRILAIVALLFLPEIPLSRFLEHLRHDVPHDLVVSLIVNHRGHSTNYCILLLQDMIWMGCVE